METFVLLGGALITGVVVSKDLQSVVEPFAPAPVVSYLKNFHYESGVTPLTSINWAIALCTGYLVSVYALREFMKDRKPMDLFYPRVLHNIILCLGSLAMFVGCVKEALAVFQKGGVEPLLCDSKATALTDPMLFWVYMFYVSKFYEFIDTYIIILRKKPLIFLHVYHHFITAILVFVGLYGDIPAQWLTLSLNTLVHVFMYFYYLVQSLGRDVWWKKYITSMQIVQFVIDLVGIGMWWVYRDVWGYKCTGTELSLFFAVAILSSFLILFMNFFAKTYTTKKTHTS